MAADARSFRIFGNVALQDLILSSISLGDAVLGAVIDGRVDKKAYNADRQCSWL